MADEGRKPEKGEFDEARRRVLWQALLGAPVIVTLSSSPAWASQYGYCNPGNKDHDVHDCRNK